jgi:hypothetical protein
MRDNILSIRYRLEKEYTRRKFIDNYIEWHSIDKLIAQEIRHWFIEHNEFIESMAFCDTCFELVGRQIDDDICMSQIERMDKTHDDRCR